MSQPAQPSASAITTKIGSPWRARPASTSSQPVRPAVSHPSVNTISALRSLVRLEAVEREAQRVEDRGLLPAPRSSSSRTARRDRCVAPRKRGTLPKSTRSADRPARAPRRRLRGRTRERRPLRGHALGHVDHDPQFERLPAPPATAHDALLRAPSTAPAPPPAHRRRSRRQEPRLANPDLRRLGERAARSVAAAAAVAPSRRRRRSRRPAPRRRGARSPLPHLDGERRGAARTTRLVS